MSDKYKLRDEVEVIAARLREEHDALQAEMEKLLSLSKSRNSDDAGNSDDGVDWDCLIGWVDGMQAIGHEAPWRGRRTLLYNLARAVLRLRDRLDAMEKKNNDGGK